MGRGLGGCAQAGGVGHVTIVNFGGGRARRWRMRTTGFLAAGALSSAAFVAAGQAPATSTPSNPVVYSAVPATLASNYASTGFEATSTSELGDQVALTRTGVLGSARVVMSSWGCQSGSWYTNDCVTTPGATFSHPVTFNVYAVDNSGPNPAPGPLLATKTQTFSIPFRPSADNVNCTGLNAGKWYSAAAATCNNGLATKLIFDMTTATGPGVGVPLPPQVIWTVAYNTSDYGATPLRPQPCNSTPQGCGYDSLNVGDEGAANFGTDVDPAGVFQSSTWTGAYCDDGTGGTGTLRYDTGCWTGYTPMAELVLAQQTSVVTVNSASVAPGGPWALEPSSKTGTYWFGPGPGTPPSGTGSLALTIASGQHEWMNNYAYGKCATGSSCNATPTAVSTIDSLSFSGYRASGTTYPSLNVEVFTDGTSSYTTFVFVPNSGAIVNGTWQNWDAMDPADGTWYSTRNTGAGTPFNCTAFSCSASWAQIQAAFPNAVVSYGIGMNVGTGGTFSGAVDDMHVGVLGVDKEYDFEPDGFPKISITPVSGPEGNASRIQAVQVKLDHPSANTVTVQYATRSGNALATSDFASANGFLTFTPGQTTATVNVTVLGDTKAERNENFYVDLSNPSNATLANGQPKLSAIVVLLNDDLPKLAATVTNVYVTEGNYAIAQFKLNFPYYQNIVVNVATANGTAVAPQDYGPIPPGTQIVFPAGTTQSSSTAFAVSVPTDGVLAEPQEQFTIIGDPVPAGMANKVVTVIIRANGS